MSGPRPGPAGGRWQDLPHGVAVMAGMILRDLARPAPMPLSTAERLAMLPTSGLPVAKPVTIHWDRHQIPFIEAGSDSDLAVALGAVHAHLRLGQIETMRRIALGRVAEMIGPLGIGIDRSIRMMELGRAVPDMIAALPAATLQWAEGFLAGINHHLRHAAELPRDCSILAIRPEPWTLTELMTLMRLSSADISWLIWSKLLRIRTRMAPRDWESLWPRLLAGGAPADPTPRSMAARVAGSMARAGSNAAAVSGGRTASGAALIASDPHLPYGLPNPWMIVGMRSPGYDCIGMMMPGLPFMALGRNPDAAWGGTSLHAQSSDLFEIDGLPDDAIEERFETIRVRGAAPRRIRLRRTAHGPLVSDGLLLPSPRRLALRWMGHRPSDELTAMLAVARCRDWPGFQAALKGFAVSGLNMVFAGRDGQVGHLLAAYLPVRPLAPSADLNLPLACEAAWASHADASDLPVRTSPRHPHVVSANQAPVGSAVPAGFFFSPPDRAQRIAALLDDVPTVGVDTLAGLQSDVASTRSLGLRDLLLAHLAIRRWTPGQQVLLSALSVWDGLYRADSRGALAFELLLAGTVGRLRGLQSRRAYDAVWMTQTLLADDLDGLPSGALSRAMTRAMAPTARRFERLHDWGGLHRITLTHPLGRLPAIGRRYRRPAFRADGGNNTVHKSSHTIGVRPHHARFGSCARHISDMSDPDANFMVLLGGQDGWFNSENFDDLTPLWRRGDYVRLPLRAGSVAAWSVFRTILEP
ncbi:penicillin acylase family protein [Lichenicola cladoniae]|uniref:Penicillin acylase family protein n=1 Tax=Lichenicola cladoniae TaxID=1484109 RepID=A0A6M8HQU3_9PROT|nr:penicillin acylase family protein [Lichenicola cladoniae]NPD68728.1 penicillin acylase family protein [Acetobacteraceae bacterium]QKE90839.1 penicillin acylase family protein [Lichenicola cladoniae]